MSIFLYTNITKNIKFNEYRLGYRKKKEKVLVRFYFRFGF